MKLIIIIGVGILVFLAVYYGRFFFTSKTVNEDVPSEMQGISVLREGMFNEIDFVHKGSGSAKILVDAQGHRVLRFEDFKVTNGPDLYVYLSKNPAPDKSKESLGDFLDLGRLKGNEGNQNYELPDDVSEYKSVVIWCRRFSALFSYATLE